MAVEPASVERPVFPVCLLLQGRPALVVGGGRVAAHKVRLLLDSEAEVTVVSPDADAELGALAAQGRIRHVPRPFTDRDIDGASVVFAATNDRHVNRRIVERCRERGILCCSVDGNWTAGDFVTPAVFRQDGLTVSVSTGGRSCRRSRMIKENLSRHVELMQTADLLVVGTSHAQLGIDKREPLHLIGQRLDRTGQMVSQVWGIHEFVLLNTCNRIELHAAVSRQSDLAPLLARLLGFDRLDAGEYYVKRGRDAFEHLALLTAGLFSQTPGENHIVAQVKEALERSAAAGWAGGLMREWVSASLHVSKDIRAVSTPLLRAFEIEDVCLEYVRAEYPHLADGRVLVLGCGAIGTGITRRLVERGLHVDLCYHIHRPDLPESWLERVRLSTFDDLRERLATAELVICATDSPHYVLLAEHAPCFPSGRPVLLVDLTMPRNVDPALDGLRPQLRTVDLEDLKHWFRRELADMDRILTLGSQTVGEHRELYEKMVWRPAGQVPAGAAAKADRATAGAGAAV